MIILILVFHTPLCSTALCPTHCSPAHTIHKSLYNGVGTLCPNSKLLLLYILTSPRSAMPSALRTAPAPRL